jgi:hypothetical protein
MDVNLSKGGNGMKKKLLIALALALILISGSAVALYHDNPAFAKNQPATDVKVKGNMDVYSPPNQKKSSEPVRKSRLKEMNIVGEAATVLNVLPITIIDEMQKGKTVVQIAKEKGLTEAEFTKKLTDLETNMVNEAVSSGTITQEHADAIKAGRPDRLKKSIKEKAVNVNDHKAMDMGN